VVVETSVCELGQDLASWLQRVQAGNEVIVTERGRPVARLTQVEGRTRAASPAAPALRRKEERRI